MNPNITDTENLAETIVNLKKKNVTNSFDASFEPQSGRSLFVVGDDAQSIYGFRGSQIEIILGFEKTFPETREIVLNQNYRSTQPILDLAEQVLTHNPHQKQKNLFTTSTKSTKIRYYQAKSEKDEAEYIVRELTKLFDTKKSQTTKNLDDKNSEKSQLAVIVRKILENMN